jgi:16S rRNA (guanine527-N7)-methyltransferase
VDNVELQQRILEGAVGVGVPLPEGGAPLLARFVSELLKWNQKVNLTAIRDAAEAVEKHIVDSLAVLPEVTGAATLLDLGTGGGLPGIPLAVALPQLQATLVDSVAKKIAFVKSATATLGLVPRVRAVHLHAAGKPPTEGLSLAACVISRAFMDVPEWVAAGRPYVAPGGSLVAMTGKDPGPLDDVARAHGFSRVTVRRYALPMSHAERHVAKFWLAD